MCYKNYFIFIILLSLSNCTTVHLENKKNKLLFNNIYTNKGFTLIYSEDLFNKKIISKKLDERSLTIFQSNLKKNTQVKITNILNDKTIIATVGNKSNYPTFNNSVISTRIANELNIDIKEPYVEIMAIPKSSLFIAKKAKTFDEEKTVADKAPVNDISINDLSKIEKNTKKISNSEFSYIIKIADFYFKDTALMMVERIVNETEIKNPEIKKISDKQYRVFLGPFKDINSLQNSYNDINILVFENMEIIKND